MKKIGLFILWMCTLLLAGNIIHASENFINDSFTKSYKFYDNINKEFNNPITGYHVENPKNGLNNLPKKILSGRNNSISLLFNLSKFCILFGIIWFISMGIISNKKPRWGTYISKKIQVILMHIKIFIFGIFNFSWIDEKIDLHSGDLKGKFADKFPVIIQYEPPKGLNSAEVGFLLYRKVRVKDLLSLIYERKADGIIDIKQEDKSKIVITRLHMIPTNYKNYEENLFDVLVPYQKTIFKKYISRCPRFHKGFLEQYGIDKGWFTRNHTPSKTIFDYICISIILVYIFSLFAYFLITKNFNALNIILGLLILFFLWVLFLLIKFVDKNLFHFVDQSSKFKETEYGAKLIAHILGYRKFLASCDENKLRTLLEKDPSYFNKILPYATVFGLKNKLIKKISPLMQNVSQSGYNLENLKYSNPESEYIILFGSSIIFVGIICLLLSILMALILSIAI